MRGKLQFYSQSFRDNLRTRKQWVIQLHHAKYKNSLSYQLQKPYYCSIILIHYYMIVKAKLLPLSSAGAIFRCGYNYPFSQTGFTQALMVRHAESEFNKYVHLPKPFLQESFRTNLHHNIRLIDCSLSKEGVLQAQKTQLPSSYVLEQRKVDILFVSPLTRALQTAELLIKANKLQVKNIIVLPELTEVLSKICDLSSPIEQKRRRFKLFDFSQMTRFLKQNDYCSEEEWQDGQVDPDYHSDILYKEKYGLRYLGILKKIFPTPLESSERCFERSLRALQLMKHHRARLNAERILVVSHNRVLKYLDGRFAKGKATGFENCEMRKLTF